jgi:hypothetical protein
VFFGLGLLMALSVRSTRSEIRDAYEWLNGHWDNPASTRVADQKPLAWQ